MYNNITTTPINPHFGVDVECDINTLTTNDRDTLIKLLVDHKVLRFTKQNLSPQSMVSFSEIFGSVWHNDSSEFLSGNGESGASHPDTRQITLVSNVGPGVLSDYEVSWHSDISHRPWHFKGGCMPFRALYATHTAPDEKSVTSWFDQEWLYDQCTPEQQQMFETFKAVYKAPYETSWEDNTIPFVLVNPITNRKAINLQKLFFVRFEHLSPSESKKITTRLFQIALQRQNVIRHEWSVGDLIISNNYNTSHQREAMRTTHRRTLWRTTFQIPELVPVAIRPADF